MSIYKVIENIEELYKKYGNKLSNDKHLLLAYWKLIDGVKMNNGELSIEDFLNKATVPNKILSAKLAYKILNNKEGER